MSSKILNFIDNLSKDERSIFKSALSRQIDQFFDNDNMVKFATPNRRSEFDQLADSLKRLSPFYKEIPNNGIVFYGHPEWLSRELLEKLILEGELRRLEPLEQIDHVLGCGGEKADKLADSVELLSFIQSFTSRRVIKTGIASYIYYDEEGAGIRPHVDTDIFALNLIIMLKHVLSDEGERSATVVFPPFQEPEFYRLEIGEALLMYGGNIIHTRTKIKKNEIVHLLTIGFNLE